MQGGWQRGTVQSMPRMCIVALTNDFGPCRTMAIVYNCFNSSDPKQLASMKKGNWRPGASSNKSYFFLVA